MPDPLSPRCAPITSRRTLTPAVSAVFASIVVAAASASADIDPVSGIEFVRITDPGNAPWPGNGTPDDLAIGHGGVNYGYRIGRLEVTTAQWVEFFNAAFDRPADDRLPHLIPPGAWGAVSTTPNTPGGYRWTVPAGNENRPVGNISWRMAAMYCNWLCNGKRTDRSAFLNGAYDVSTFVLDPNTGLLNDQISHNPDAQYWIPTWDEWLKAAHYDPDRYGPGEGGWWEYSNSSDEAAAPGPPGIGDANYGWDDRQYPGLDEFTVPLGAYPDVQSPWGLLDAAGATSEWTEGVIMDFNMMRRIDEGSYWGSSSGFVNADAVFAEGVEFPSISISQYGLRIAAVVPAPPPAATVLGCAVLMLTRRRRRGPDLR